MSLAHMAGLVYVRCSSTEESPIVLVYLIFLRSLSSVESSKIRPKVWILTHTGANSASISLRGSGCLRRTWVGAILDRANLVQLLIVQVFYIIEGLIGFCKLACGRRLVA